MTSLQYLPWFRPAAFDDRAYLADAQHDLTYAEFGQWVDAVAEQFGELGVDAGDVVAIMLSNRVELVVAMVAAWRLGAAATPINPAFTADEADYQINDAGAVLVINASVDAPDGGRRSLMVDELRRHSRGVPLPAPATDRTDTALLVYTSGSTGRPKGVILSHGNLGATMSMLTVDTAIQETDHALVVLPLFHVNAIFASFLLPSVVGARMSILGRFRPDDFVAAVERYRPTYFSAVPTIYSMLLSSGVSGDFSSVRFGICGAAPASAELLAATEEKFGFPLVEGYGLTESSCVSTANPIDGLRKVGSVGRALTGQRVAIMDEQDRLLGSGERGEVVIQGENVMVGYLNRPEATAEVLRDGWLHTGDVGVFDEDGYLWVVDRIKDMIIRGGENLYPKEIEAVLHRHPAVMEAAVVGAVDATYGEQPVAFVTTYPDAEVIVEELLELCRANLTRIKVPIAVHIVDQLPRNPIGKVYKPALRAQLASAEPALDHS